jgi:hypothetical protein
MIESPAYHTRDVFSSGRGQPMRSPVLTRDLISNWIWPFRTVLGWIGRDWTGLDRSRLGFTHFHVGGTNGNRRLVMLGVYITVLSRRGPVAQLGLNLVPPFWSFSPWPAMGICFGGYIAM